MEEKRFNPDRLERLNNPERIHDFPVERISKLTGLENPGLIVDLGAGTAFYSKALAKLYPNCRFMDYDISDVMVEWMKANVVNSFPNIIPTIIEDVHIPLEDHVADLVFMVNLHHELDDPEGTLRECYRILKPGRALAISDWRKEFTGGHGPSIEIRVTPEEVMEQAVKAGFGEIQFYRDLPNNFLVIAKKS